MRGFNVVSAALGLVIGVLAAAPASAWIRGPVDVLAVLPFASGSVEGLTVGTDGNIYVPTFGFNGNGAIPGPPVLFVISPNGSIVRQVAITCTQLCGFPPNVTVSPHILGLRFNPSTSRLWVLDFGDKLVLEVDPQTGITTRVLAGPITGSGLNALTFDSVGNGYVSDSFNGAIWKIGPTGGIVGNAPWITDPLLSPSTIPGTSLTPPFGANGVEFSNDGNTLFVANTAYHQIIQIPVKQSGGTLTPDPSNPPSIFITGINAPDGIAIDSKDNIWICANQEDEIVVIDKTGKVIAKLGDFRGIDQNGIARGFLFPASLAFNKDRSTLYVSNLTLYLPFAGVPHKAIDSDWTLQVKGGYTVSKLPAQIPSSQNDQGNQNNQ
jgi:sugar lactone lactonase YvrE